MNVFFRWSGMQVAYDRPRRISSLLYGPSPYPGPVPQRAPRHKVDEQGQQLRVTWPKNRLPLEIFEMIHDLLSPGDIRRLRLVCREFEAKASSHCFRNVVIPRLFSGAETYPNHGGIRCFGSDDLDILQSLGPLVRRFALSLEVNEKAIAHPPADMVVKATTAKWGDLPFVRMKRDKADGIEEAMQCLTEVANLGLSCDTVHSPISYRRGGQDLVYTRVASTRLIFRDRLEEPEPGPSADLSRGRHRSDGMAAVENRMHETRSDFTVEESSAERPMSTTTSCFNVELVKLDMVENLQQAHRAMIESYLNSIITNVSLGSLRNVTSFTIAKMPSRHVPELCRHDVWQALPALKHVSIAVLVDWERTTTVLNELLGRESSVISNAHLLLDEYIGTQPNISSVHFEWICGGELTPGFGQRNRFILPAPFVANPWVTVTRTFLPSEAILSLPHVKHLSLKNCWTPPHVLLRTVGTMAYQSLESLNFEAFSLSGPVDEDASFSIYYHMRRLRSQALFGLDPPPPVEPVVHVPGLSTWDGLLEHFGTGLEEDEDDGTGIDRTDASEAARRVYKLETLSFKSCGYVAVDWPDIRSGDILPTSFEDLPWANYARGRDSDMRLNEDRMMAMIVPYLKPDEVVNLKRAFGMVTGWDGVYDEDTIQEALDDGIVCPGVGRFSGVLKTVKSGNFLGV
ncbi:hypothetical protein XA68_17715 [Ophiocordyceps unilateralis]|uniref:F-box domain-containing protein n=1 Tax=Ophiocordyceps unilateralis TaxID=268505 RepID=A0A2A9PIX7_OPHUN|nr:hypothetical protein XA68_17715 [Ophiocordyceps unilateralis]